MLTRADFNTHMYTEIINNIERDAGTLLEKAIKAAIQEAKGFLSKYDLETLFGSVDDDRDELLLTFLKDIAVWHFIVLANPNMNIEFQAERYEKAIQRLKQIQKGEFVPDGWPRKNEPEGISDSWKITSAPRRNTQY